MKKCQRDGCKNPVIIHEGTFPIEFPICQEHMDEKPIWNTKNLPETKFGYCENSTHEDDENQQKETLELILHYNEEDNTFSKEGDYWCKSCSGRYCEY